MPIPPQMNSYVVRQAAVFTGSSCQCRELMASNY